MEKMTISAAETAKRLGISDETVLRLLEFGEIPAVRMGKSWLVPVKTLEQWLCDRAYKEAKERRE